MKALVLTVFPEIPPNPRPAEPLTRMNPKFRACMEWDEARAIEDRLSYRKRLTDAELAAEVHSQRETWAAALYDDVYARYVEDEGELTSMKERFEMGEKAKTLYRFATRPHYDEVTS